MNPDAGDIPDASPDASPDEQVISRVLTGSTSDFRLLVTRYYAPVYRMGRRFLRLHEDVQDYVQDVFVKSYTRLGQFGGRGRFYSWLMRLAYNLAVDRIKSRPRDVTGFDPEPEDPTPGPIEQTMRSAARRAVNEAVAELPSVPGRCIELFFYDGLTYEEIAQTTGMPVNTIKSHVLRAKKRLRRALEGTAAEMSDGM